jgi:hypothetical protein
VSGSEGASLVVPLEAFDADGDPIVAWADNLPPGASFDAVASALVWTPGFTAAGIYRDVRFTVSDGISLVSQTFDITMLDAPRPPQLLPLAPRSVLEGQTLVVTLRPAEGSQIVRYGLTQPVLGGEVDEARGILCYGLRRSISAGPTHSSFSQKTPPAGAPPRPCSSTS